VADGAEGVRLVTEEAVQDWGAAGGARDGLHPTVQRVDRQFDLHDLFAPLHPDVKHDSVGYQTQGAQGLRLNLDGVFVTDILDFFSYSRRAASKRPAAFSRSPSSLYRFFAPVSISWAMAL